MNLENVYRSCVPLLAKSIAICLVSCLPGITVEAVSAWVYVLHGRKGGKKVTPPQSKRTKQHNTTTIRIYSSLLSANQR